MAAISLKNFCIKALLTQIALWDNGHPIAKQIPPI